MKTDVPPPDEDYGQPDPKWGHLVDADSGIVYRPATEAEYQASAGHPGGRGTFWGPFGRRVYVNAQEEE